MSDQTIKSVKIADREIGPDQPCFIIGEAGLNHNGDLDLAKKLIDRAAEAGCDCVKFQRRTVSMLTTDALLDAEDARFPSLGKTYREIRQRHEFDADEFGQLVEYGKERNLIVMCTPFDIPALDFLEQFDLPAYKIASHSVTNLPLLEHLAKVGKPVIMSTGMCTFEELDRAVNTLQSADIPLILLHCVSAYPTPAEQQELHMIGALSERYQVPVGYSGHEIGMLPSLLSVALGATVVERHITESNDLEGFDHKISLAPVQLQEMVGEIRKIETMMGTPEKSVTETEQITRDKYHVSMISARPIEAGEVIQKEMIVFKNPGTGLPPSRIDEVVGRRAKAAIPADHLLSFDELES